MPRTIEELRAIGQMAEAKLVGVYELYSMGEPPILTPGIVEAVLEAAETIELRQDGAAGRRSAGAQPDKTAPTPKSKIVIAPADDVEAAVIARLRELAVEGQMPEQATWDERRGDLPKAKYLWQKFGKRGWGEWAALAGLAYAGKRRVRRKARKTEAPAPTPEAAFRDAQVSERTASILGPEHVVVSPHGSERNGAPARD